MLSNREATSLVKSSVLDCYLIILLVSTISKIIHSISIIGVI
ncbi:hypothetical protein BCI_0200 [Baumannia cicadellinicola str. Hc (Homalodisca coagulata)]|uniref:Uncharacterized protein n=1 Tax=Baumannia cicadellinicola subsp. Homalodisca coagulata TaxID=374463 RepID=Q1LTQ7_BAUCH|nr:hypothetical protein BCI_0200 [Baumannia cicadellinicola str. Hc (Homalodisca coagulata)]